MHLWYLQRHNDVIITFRTAFTFSYKHKIHKNNEAETGKKAGTKSCQK